MRNVVFFFLIYLRKLRKFLKRPIDKKINMHLKLSNAIKNNGVYDKKNKKKKDTKKCKVK